jgi:hypothetical protein
MSLTDDDFMITEPASYDPFPGLQNTFNAITGTYVEPADVWEGRSADAILNSTWETDDGGRRLTVDVGLPAVSSKSQAQQLLTSYIKDQRRFRVHRMVLPPSFALLEPLDTISWTSTANGYTSRVFEITAVEDRPNTLNQFVTVRERSAADVAWDTGDDVASPDPTNGLTIPARIVPTLTVTAFNIQDGDGAARRPAIKIEWPADEALSADLLKYEVRLAGDTVNLATSSTVGAREGQTVTTDGLVSDTIYEVRAQYVTDMPADWTSWIAVTTGDVRFTDADIVDSYNFRVDQAFERHDQALDTLTNGSVFQLLNDTRITDAILAAQNSTSDAQQVVAFEGVGDAAAAIVTEQTARADGDTAVAATVTTLTARVDDNEAAIVTEQTARADADTAISTTATTLAGRVDDNEGSITTINATKVDADGAVSAVETQISATYGSLTALASATSFAKAAVDGIESGFVFELNGSNVLELISVQDGSSNPVSTARILADYVEITGLAQINQAVIDNLAVDTGFISNLTVDTINIAGEAVNTAQLTGNAVSTVRESSGTSNQTLTWTAAADGTVILIASGITQSSTTRPTVKLTAKEGSDDAVTIRTIQPAIIGGGETYPAALMTISGIYVVTSGVSTVFTFENFNGINSSLIALERRK